MVQVGKHARLTAWFQKHAKSASLTPNDTCFSLCNLTITPACTLMVACLTSLLTRQRGIDLTVCVLPARQLRINKLSFLGSLSFAQLVAACMLLPVQPTSLIKLAALLVFTRARLQVCSLCAQKLSRTMFGARQEQDTAVKPHIRLGGAAYRHLQYVLCTDVTYLRT